MAKISRVLVANRGEIAVRVMRAAHRLGIESVAVYSEADSGAQHVRLATHRISLGASTAKDSYLNQRKLIAAALQSGADAIHPGYGFLSENAAFAKAVEDSGLLFIGPKSQHIALMGDKNQARKKAAELGVPVVPGTEPGMPAPELIAFAEKVGFPVIIKAVAGGSGRGMRIVEHRDELEGKLAEASAEAASAFGNGDVFLEKFIVKPRHIEVQVFGDGKGGAIHFGERECSLQRRYQKLVEEAPAPNLHPKLRERICAAAVALVRGVQYSGAGTVECIVAGGTTEDSPFYFLEMNTRIQVEHPVTEEVTGADLVALQFRLVENGELGIQQSQIETRGHAIEFRVYAENPAENFRPALGTVRYLSRAGGPGVREDGWVESGSRVSPFYDAMLSKLIIWGQTRDEAIGRAREALDAYVLEGMPTTLGFHRWLLRQPDYLAAHVDVGWIERSYRGELVGPRAVGPLTLPPAEDPQPEGPAFTPGRGAAKQ